MQIIPFEGKALPAYLRKSDADRTNSDLLAHAGGGFPVISIKGKMFAVVKDGARTILPNPKDPDSPATSIDVVLIKVNGHNSKVFYARGYDPEASERQKPTCYSNDGVAPAADAQEPQAKKCAMCPHNQWGAKVSDSGKKGKACSDSVRAAVAAAGQVNEPMLLRIPPATIRALGDYGQMLDKRGVKYNSVVTKIAFDQEAESPKLTFKPVGFIDEQTFNDVVEMAESDTVRNILGGSGMPEVIDSLAEADLKETSVAAQVAKAPKTKNVSLDEVASAIDAAVEAGGETVAKKATVEVKKPRAPVEVDLDVELDGIDFDD